MRCRRSVEQGNFILGARTATLSLFCLNHPERSYTDCLLRIVTERLAPAVFICACLPKHADANPSIRGPVLTSKHQVGTGVSCKQ